MRRTEKWLGPAMLVGALLATPGLSAEPVAEPADERVERLCEVYSNKESRGNIASDLIGTPLAPGATGEALFRFRKGTIVTKLRTRNLPSPSRIGREYLTYVAWSVDDADRFQSLGEIRSRDKVGRLETTLPWESLGLVVTAEPHFAVTRPSDTVVLRAVPVGKSTKKLRSGETECSFLPRGRYTLGRTEEELGVLLSGDARTPGSVLQARNAVAIAKLSGSGEYASERYRESAAVLLRAQELLARGRRDDAEEVARQAVELAASAERIGAQRRDEDRRTALELQQTRERLAAVERELESAKKAADAEAARRQELEAQSRETAADERLRSEQASLERIERALERLHQTPPRPEPPTAATVPASAESSSERERALEKQLLETRLEIEKLRLDMELAQQRATVERERERLQTERSFFEAEQGRLADEQARVAAERKRLEAERAAPPPPPRAESPRSTVEPDGPRASPTPAVAEPVAPSIPSQPEPAAPAVAEIATQRTAEPAPTPQQQQQQQPARPATAPARLDPELDASIRRREREIELREAELASREAELEQARQELAQRDAEPEATSAAEVLLAQNTDLEPAESPAKPKRSLWPFGRKKRKAEQAAQSAVLTAPPAEASGQTAMAAERAELDRRWEELQYAREQLLIDRQSLALERPSRAAAAGVPAAPVQVVPAPQVTSATQQPPVTLVYTPPTTGIDASVAAERSRIEDQQRRLLEQQEQLIALTQELGETEAEADRVALQQQLDERTRSLEMQHAELEQERTRLERLGERLENERKTQEIMARRADLIGRLTRAGGEVIDQGNSTVVRLPGSFVTGRATLRPEMQDRLASVVVAMASLSGLSVTVEGHTDDSGDESTNLELSRRRAEAVRDRLVALGLPGSSITASGIGEVRPIASNTTAEGRARNRRVDLIITADEILRSAPNALAETAEMDGGNVR